MNVPTAKIVFPVANAGDMQASVFITQWTTETVFREKKTRKVKRRKCLSK